MKQHKKVNGQLQGTLLLFQELIPSLAQGLMHQIDKEFAQNLKFVEVFQQFQTLCQQVLHQSLSYTIIQELLVQYLLTERLFYTVFNNPDFVNRNLLATEMTKVVTALTSQGFKPQSFLHELDLVYQTIVKNVQEIEDFAAKQDLLNTLYEHFFQGFSVKQADTHGIIYTPQAIVDFMWNSIEVILQHEFNLTLSAPTVQILDPCVGTGNFILNLLKRISRQDLQRKYETEIFCNEVLLFPYYIAALNIEHCYFELMNQYLTYPGICLVDTLNLAKSPQLDLFNEENSNRVAQQKAAPLTVIIGNPPYNVGQQNENDNNKNRKYAVIDSRIRETYAKDSRATNKNALSDAYVKFFRWAVDRLDSRDGIICFVSNNGFLEGIAFDGFRQHLAHDFTTIYHLNLGGNARKGGGGSVFGIMVGVGITILVRKRAKITEAPAKATLLYHALADQIKGAEKLALLTKHQSIKGFEWQVLQPDAKNNWLTAGLLADFETFLPLGTKEAKTTSQSEALFKLYSNGVKTNRDIWVYNFHQTVLTANIQRFIQHYNHEVERWQQQSNKDTQVDDFITNDETKIKWSEGFKRYLERGRSIIFDVKEVRSSLYRPFCRQYLYFNRFMVERVYQFPSILPTPASEKENLVICLTGIGAERPFTCLVTNLLPNLIVTAGFGASSQCFPFYTYAEDGRNRQENITDWAVKQFEAQYGVLEKISDLCGFENRKGLQIDSTKKAIFFYVYALLQHPLYRKRYQENLKRELPRLPLIGKRQTFLTLVEIGQKLADLHLNYETVEEYPLEWVENKQIPWTWRVEKMKLTKAKDAIIVNRCLTLKGIPASAFEYQLGNRSALEWIIDQYQITTDKRNGITNDPNRVEEPEYIVHLVGKIITVSVKTVKLMERLWKDLEEVFGKSEK